MIIFSILIFWNFPGSEISFCLFDFIGNKSSSSLSILFFCISLRGDWLVVSFSFLGFSGGSLLVLVDRDVNSLLLFDSGFDGDELLYFPWSLFNLSRISWGICLLNNCLIYSCSSFSSNNLLLSLFFSFVFPSLLLSSVFSLSKSFSFF